MQISNLSQLQAQLKRLGDLKYRNFHIPLIPTVNPSTVIGVRVPVLRKFAKEFNNSEFSKSFIKILPHEYFEEYNLHAFLIEQINDFELCKKQLDLFLPFVNNWATCDCMSPKVLKSDKQKLKNLVFEYVKSSEIYKIRFGIVCAMRAFTGEDFCQEITDKIASLKSDEYYVNMAIGWFFATLLTKNYSQTLPYLQDKKLQSLTHNLAIKKACESLAVPSENKEYLKSLKIKGE